MDKGNLLDKTIEKDGEQMFTFTYMYRNIPPVIGYVLAGLAIVSFIALCILLFKTIRSDKDGDQK